LSTYARGEANGGNLFYAPAHWRPRGRRMIEAVLAVDIPDGWAHAISADLDLPTEATAALPSGTRPLHQEGRGTGRKRIRGTS